MVGGALSKIAEVQTDSLANAIRAGHAAGLSDEEIATQISASLDWSRLSWLIDYALRLQLRASARRKLTVSDPQVVATGQLAFNQSDFGITPFSILGGAVAVQDQVALRFDIVARRQE